MVCRNEEITLTDHCMCANRDGSAYTSNTATSRQHGAVAKNEFAGNSAPEAPSVCNYFCVWPDEYILTYVECSYRIVPPDTWPLNCKGRTPDQRNSDVHMDPAHIYPRADRVHQTSDGSHDSCILQSDSDRCFPRERTESVPSIVEQIAPMKFS
jgi:hypothetical protein